jgi:ABC-type uncharacterized transport system permease subunit
VTRRIARLSYVVLTALQFLFFAVAMQVPARAYVDPGSGILVMQFASSIIGAGIFFVRKRLKQFFFTAKSAPIVEQDREEQS